MNDATKITAARQATREAVTPVYGFRDGRKETVAHFFDSWDAIDYVQANIGKRNLYLAPSLPLQPTFFEPLTDVTVKQLSGGRSQVSG